MLPDARRGTIIVLAAACGIMVGNVYLCQPLLDEIALSFAVSEGAAGLVAVAAQIGFALGILFIVPLADVAEPRRLVRVMMAVAALGLVAAAAAPALSLLVVAGTLVAAATVVPQVLIPLATALAPPERRGRVIGALQTGLVLGILLSRTVSGAVASAAGSWRAAYLLAGLLTGGLFLILPAFMPSANPAGVADGEPPLKRQSYVVLMRSLLPLPFAYRPLRISMGLGFCVFGAFSAFWATLAFHLATPQFGLGPAATGLFGLWGAPGAMLAPLGGRLADCVGPNRVNIAALASAGMAFLVAGLLGGVSLIALLVTVNLLDFGLQSGQIANQIRIFALGTGIRGRLNTVYMVAVFSGGSCGSLLGTMAWGIAGWSGVCAVAGGFVALAAVILATSSAGRIAPGAS